ncbi:MAG: hypothetical protein B6I17_03775 [Tenericutes bacterium 4572_104]|nr:MAG: hypothetical protein B6I17_03775 [Tenericutes bacterium 4572_104]
MAQLHGSLQIQDGTISIAKLMSDFLNGSDWNASGGNNNATITGLSAGVNANDAVNFQQLTDLINGRKWKNSVRAFEQVANLTLSGTQTIDGVALADGDLIAVFAQTTTTEDGVYIVRAGAWERSPEWQAGVGCSNFSFFVEEGIIHADTQKTVTNNSTSDIIGTDDLTVVQTGGAGTITASNGVLLNGNNIELGGSLTRTTDIDLDGNIIRVYDGNIGSSAKPMLLLASDGATTGDWRVGGSMMDDSAYIRGTSESGPVMDLGLENSSGDFLRIDFRNTGTAISSGIIIEDDLYSMGMSYTADYSVAGINSKGNRWIPDAGWVNAQITNAGIVAGAGLVNNTGTFNIVATDLSLIVNADDMQVNIGNTNGTSLELTASGVELASIITGARAFTTGDAAFSVDAGTAAVSLTGTNIIFDGGSANSVTLTNQPTGTTALAVATTSYVDSAVSSGYVFTGGLTATGSNPISVSLGGNLNTGTTTLGLGNDRFFDMIGNLSSTSQGRVRMEINQTSSNSYSRIEVTDTGARVRSSDNNSGTGFEAYFETGMGSASMVYRDEGTGFRKSFNSNFYVLDQVDSRGLVYAADYSANYTLRSLVDREYVDNAISGGGESIDQAMTVAGATATLTSAPTTGMTKQKVYLNGQRLTVTTDYTVTNATTGQITEAGTTTFAGQTVTCDYIDA